MKNRKCPYCGKRISYFTVFNEKQQGEHICQRCGKESKIMIKKNIFVFFLIAIIFAAVIATVWIGLGFINNPIGVLLVAIPLFIFYLCTPRFVRIYPLKKYKKSMEAAKAAREYSGEVKFKRNYGNNIKKEPDVVPVVDTETEFKINENVFSSIKANRKKPIIDGSVSGKNFSAGETVVVNKQKTENFVPIIENSREAHASSSENVPLQKIHKEKPVYEEPSKYDFSTFEEKPNTSEVEKKKKIDGSKYSANRRF